MQIVQHTDREGVLFLDRRRHFCFVAACNSTLDTESGHIFVAALIFLHEHNHVIICAEMWPEHHFVRVSNGLSLRVHVYIH